MRLGLAGRRFERTLRVLDGPYFSGQFLDIPDTTRVSNFNSARRILRTRHEGMVQVGQIIVDRASVKWLVGEHGLSENDHHYFKLYQVDQTLPWTRSVKIKDPLTGLERTISEQAMGIVYGTFERRVAATDALNIPEPANVLITNADLHLNDLVDRRRVVRVDHQLGLTIAEVIG